MGKRLDAYLEAVERNRNPYENYKYAEGPAYFKEKELYDKWESENNSEYHNEQNKAQEQKGEEYRNKLKQAEEIVLKYAREIPDNLKASKTGQQDDKESLLSSTNRAIDIAKKVVDELNSTGFDEQVIDKTLRGIHNKFGIVRNGFKIAGEVLSYYHHQVKGK